MPRRSEEERFLRVRELYDFDESLVRRRDEDTEIETRGREDTATAPRPRHHIPPPPDLPISRSPRHPISPTLCPSLAGFDEAGRGALAGPVVVGCVHFPFFSAITNQSVPSSSRVRDVPVTERSNVLLNHSPRASDVGAIPRGTNHSMIQSLNGSILRSLSGIDDSKRLTARQRETLCPRIKSHALWGIGIASAEEIDKLGIVLAVSLAARRAYLAMGVSVDLLLCDRGIKVLRDSEIERLNHLTPQASDSPIAQSPDHSIIQFPHLPLSQSPNDSIAQSTELSFTRGDSRSLHIAAASIIAKVTRDRIMVDVDRQFSGYGFAQHKGYGTAAHLAALRRLGPSPIHRQSFHVK